MILTFVFCACALESVSAQLDRQQIDGGGTIVGRLLDSETEPSGDGNNSGDNNSGNDNNGGDAIAQIALVGGGSLALDRSLIKKSQNLSDAQRTYRLEAPLADDTTEAHEKYAVWCRENGLVKESRRHWERILELDAQYEPAHKALGHVKTERGWMTPQERREQYGYETFGGRSLTRQEAELARIRAEEKKRLGDWRKQLRKIAPGLRVGDPAAKDALRQISEPEALAAVTEMFRKEEDPLVRVLYVQAAGRIGTPAAMGDLATIALVDDHYEVRLAALDIILANEKAVPGAIRLFRASLNRPENHFINRAAAALAYFHDVESVGPLINSLVTRHRQTVVEGGSQTTASFSSDGSFAFNPGSGPTTKVITETVENDDVLTALRSLTAEGPSGGVDFGFDVEAWKNWYLHRKEIDKFAPRRDF